MKSKITTKQSKPPDIVGVDHTGAFVVRGVGGGGDPHSIDDHSAAETRAHFSTVETAKVKERLRRFRESAKPKVKTPVTFWHVLAVLVSALAWIAFAVALLIALNALDKTLR